MSGCPTGPRAFLAGGGSGGSGGSSVTDPGTEGDGKRTLAKPFNAAPEVSSQNGVPHGAKLKFVMAKGSTQRYADANDREINVYVPMLYKDDSKRE